MPASSTIILITGANSGVGYAIAEVLGSAHENYHIIMACRNSEKAKKALAEIKASEGIRATFSTVKLDLHDAASVEAAAKEVEEQFGHVDVLINNAGIAYNIVSAETFENTMKTNVLGPILVTSSFKHLLLKSKSPYSVYISSSLGSFDRASDKNEAAYNGGWVTYRQSKAALNMWALEESKVLGEKGVKTFVMCPGYVVSNLRGTSEEQRSGWGYASDPHVSGQTMLSIVEGKRDADVGKFVHKDGVYAW